MEENRDVFGSMFGEESKEEIEEGVSGLMNLFEQDELAVNREGTAATRCFRPSVPPRASSGFTGLMNQYVFTAAP